MGLFRNKKCAFCTSRPKNLWPVLVASGNVKMICKRCKGAMGGKKRPR